MRGASEASAGGVLTHRPLSSWCKATQFLDDVGGEHGWFVAFLKAHEAGKSLAQACESWRRESRSATRSCFTTETTPSMSRRRVSEKSVLLNSLFFQVWLNISTSAAP